MFTQTPLSTPSENEITETRGFAPPVPAVHTPVSTYVQTHYIRELVRTGRDTYGVRSTGNSCKCMRTEGNRESLLTTIHSVPSNRPSDVYLGASRAVLSTLCLCLLLKSFRETEISPEGGEPNTPIASTEIEPEPPYHHTHTYKHIFVTPYRDTCVFPSSSSFPKALLDLRSS